MQHTAFKPSCLPIARGYLTSSAQHQMTTHLIHSATSLEGAYRLLVLQLQKHAPNASLAPAGTTALA